MKISKIALLACNETQALDMSHGITLSLNSHQEVADVADIKAFPGLRPQPQLVDKVASPPYDVLNSEEARAIAKNNQNTFLRVVKAEVDLAPDVDVHSDEVYARSAENFNRLIDDGVLIKDPTPCFYIYKLKMQDHVQHGLVVGASVDEYESGTIKKHEHTRRDKEDDRARHVQKLMANAGPVLFTYKAEEKISDKIQALCQTEPIYDFVADDGVGHSVWKISQADDIKWLQEAFKSVPALYIADGHHRSASAYRVRNNLRDANPHHTGDEAYNHFLAVLFPDNELQIMGYHRVIKDLKGMEPGEFWVKVHEKFKVESTKNPEPQGPKTFTCFLDGDWWRLEAKPGTFPQDDPVRSLDVSILQDNLLAPILGIGDPRTDQRIDFVGGIRGTKELERRCADDSRIAFALYPVSVGQLMAIADAGQVMPPKSTWFEPKLRSGVVVRSLEET